MNERRKNNQYNSHAAHSRVDIIPARQGNFLIGFQLHDFSEKQHKKIYPKIEKHNMCSYQRAQSAERAAPGLSAVGWLCAVLRGSNIVVMTRVKTGLKTAKRAPLPRVAPPQGDCHGVWASSGRLGWP